MEKKNNVKIAYLGTSKASSVVLEDLIKAGFEIVGIFCKPDKASGRGKLSLSCPTKIVANKYGLPVYQPESKEILTDQMINLAPDLAVVFAYGMILPREAFEAPKYKTINIHPSLLPKYRGPSPLNWPILNGDKETGISIILITENMDAGPVLDAKKETIRKTDTAESLENRLAKAGSTMMIDLIPKWVDGKIKTAKQDDSKATYTSMLKKEDGRIDWARESSQIERHIRAFMPWPGSFTYWEKDSGKFTLKITKGEAKKGTKVRDLKPGETFLDDGELSIQTGGGILKVKKLQLEGRKELDSKDFILGHPEFLKTVLK